MCKSHVMMATANTAVVQLACFSCGDGPAKEATAKNGVICVDANRQGDLLATGVHKRIKMYSYRETLLRSPSRIHFPLVNVHSDGKITSLKFAHINTFLAYGDSTGQVGVMDTSTGYQHFKCIVGHKGYVSSLAYTKCGRLLVSGGSDSKVKIWTNETLQPVYSLDTKQQVHSVCPHLYHPYLLAYTTKETLNYLDLRNPQAQLFELTTTADLKSASFISSAEIVAMPASDELQLWNVDSLSVTRRFKDPMNSRHFTGFDVFNDIIVCGCENNALYFFHKNWCMPQHYFLIQKTICQTNEDLPPGIKNFLASADCWKSDHIPSTECVTAVCWIKENHALAALSNGLVYVMKVKH